MASTLSQAQLDSVADKGSREAARILGVGKSTVNKYREVARLNGGVLPFDAAEETNDASSILETRTDGSLIVETKDRIPQTKGEVDAAMIKRGFNPEEYDFTYRFSEWDARDAEGVFTMYAARAGATPRRGVLPSEALDVSELLDIVRDWTFTPVIKGAFNSVDLVPMFADPQLGKTDLNGGTTETVNQIMGSYAALVELAKEEKPREIVFSDLGDGLENFQNTSSQAQTNDLDLTQQVRVLRRMQAEGLRMLAPYCEILTHASCPSNHGQVRIAPQQQASTESNDWGIEVSHQLEDVFEYTPFDINFVRPKDDYAVSTAHTTASGTRLGLTHGDKAGNQPALGTWWQRQAFGWDNPLRDVDILLVGHYHNQAIEEIYEGRWLIVGASSDRGSSWFTNKTGRSATSGMSVFLTAERKFWNLQLV